MMWLTSERLRCRGMWCQQEVGAGQILRIYGNRCEIKSKHMKRTRGWRINRAEEKGMASFHYGK